MGQEIFYCDGCKVLVRSAELEKGKAFRVDGRILCVKCAGPQAAPAARSSMSSGTHRAQTATRRAAAPAPAKSSPAPWLLGAAIALALAAALLLSRSSPPPPPPEEPRPAPVARPEPLRPAPPPAPPAPAPRREEQARLALREARAWIADHPGDRAGQEERARRAALEAEGTPVADEARRLLDELQARAKSALDAEIAALVDRAAFGDALDRLDRAGARERAEEVRGLARRAFPAIRDRALDALKRQADADVQAALAEVDRWGLPDLSRDFRTALAPPAAPAPVVAAPVADPWFAAMSAAAARDYAAAAQLAKAAEDIDALRAAGAVYVEALQILSRWPKGQKLSVDYLDLAGERRQADDPVLRTTPAWAELKRDKGSVYVEFSEVLPSTLAALYLKKTSRPEPRAAALFLLVEGDGEAASKLAPAASIPERYWKWAEARKSPSPREAEARRLHAEAERQWIPLSTRGESAARYRTLLADFADTEFVRRRRAALAPRAEAPREFAFEPEDLASSGGFRLGTDKAGPCWTNSGEPGALEAEFWAAGGVEFRAWACVGACCAESSLFTLSGSDLGESSLRTKSLPAGRTHAGHQGRKPALTWSWTPLPLPKYAEGRKKLRLASDHAGFAVACIVVSAVREAAPVDADLKEFARLRAENPPALRVGTRAFYRGFNLNGPPVTIDGNLWEGKGAKDLATSGAGFENQNVPLDPKTDPDRTLMIRTSIWAHEGTSVIVTAVPSGTYQVYLYVWEDNNPETFDLLLKGKVVQSRYCSGPGGHWDRLGPWTVDVADGVIDLRATPADANFSGLELWRVYR